MLEMLQTLFDNLMFFALHFENSSVFPKPLSAKEEAECFRLMSEGDSAARNRLIEHNLRLVAHIVKKYYTASDDSEDLISIGTIGLIKAASSFDYTKNTKFATYASRCIENAIVSLRNARVRNIICSRKGVFGCLCTGHWRNSKMCSFVQTHF